MAIHTISNGEPETLLVRKAGETVETITDFDPVAGTASTWEATVTADAPYELVWKDTLDREFSEFVAASGGFTADDRTDLQQLVTNDENRDTAEQVASFLRGELFDAETVASGAKLHVYLEDGAVKARTVQFGTGTVPIDHDFPVDDEWRIMESDGINGAEATIRAFVATEYAINPATATQEGETTTDTDGYWVRPMYLRPGITYTLVVTGEYCSPIVDNITVPDAA